MIDYRYYFWIGLVVLCYVCCIVSWVFLWYFCLWGWVGFFSAGSLGLRSWGYCLIVPAVFLFVWVMLTKINRSSWFFHWISYLTLWYFHTNFILIICLFSPQTWTLIYQMHFWALLQLTPKNFLWLLFWGHPAQLNFFCVRKYFTIFVPQIEI